MKHNTSIDSEISDMEYEDGVDKKDEDEDADDDEGDDDE
jgi:hypothetical protein